MTLNEKTAKQIYEALKRVVAIADRDTVEFRAAHAALVAAEANSPVDEEFALEQVMRMAGLPRYPEGKIPAIQELVRIAMKAERQDLLKGAVTDILEYSDDSPCPSPGALKREILRVTTDRLGEFEWDINCPRCHGAGWIENGPKCNCLKRRKNQRYIMPVEEVSQ